MTRGIECKECHKIFFIICQCSECKGSFCLKHIYQYVDGNNISITKNSPPLCKECYVKRYRGEK